MVGVIRKCLTGSIILILFIFAGCVKKQYSDSYDSQIENIEKFMVSEKYEYRNINGAYVTILGAGLPNAEVLVAGDSIYFSYTLHPFTTSIGGLIDTNIKEFADQAGLEKTEEQLKPFGAKYGTTELISGLNNGLQDSKVGETLLILLPFNEAYGEEYLDIVPPYTSIAFQIVVNKIVKN